VGEGGWQGSALLRGKVEETVVFALGDRTDKTLNDFHVKKKKKQINKYITIKKEKAGKEEREHLYVKKGEDKGKKPIPFSCL
jgi:hypothetical protein